MNTILWDYESDDPMFDLKIFVGHCDLYLYPSIYAEGYIVFVFLFVCTYVRLFVRSFVLPSHSWNSFKVLLASNSSGVYLTNHSSESVHIWTIGTLEGRLSFHDS